MSSMDDTETNRFADPILWLVILMFGLVLYVFVYPPVVFMFASKTNILGSADGLVQILDLSLAPLGWLSNNVPIYDRYLAFLADWIM